MCVTSQLHSRWIFAVTAAILVLSNATGFAQALSLAAGQTVVFEFTSISNSGPTTSMDQSKVIAWFEPGTFGFGDEATLEIFADSLADTPLTSAFGISQFPDRVGLAYWWLGFGPTPPPVFFPGLQGVLRVTMISGSALAGPDLVPHLDVAIRWLSDPGRLLAHCTEDGKLIATSLGAAAARGSLPLQLASSIGQLVRDLLSLGADETILVAWTGLDHLLLLELLAERSWSLRSFSADLADKVDAWLEKSGDKSVLYAHWIRGAKGHSKALELFGSLGIAPEQRPDDLDDWCRRRAYLAMFRAIILWQRSGGETPENLSRAWCIDNLSGIEEAWRDGRLWLLGALAEIFEVKYFYYHLRSEYAAEDERVKRVKRCLQRMRILALQTAARLKHCSLLGPLLVQMRRGARGSAGIGLKTIEKLEALGIQDLVQITRMSVSDFKHAGIAPAIATRLQAYLRRRMA